MPRSSVTAVFALLVTLAGAAGCSSAHKGSSSAPSPTHPPSPSQAMITWVGSVCSADSELQVQQAAAGTAALSVVARHGTLQQTAGFIAVLRSDLAGSLTTFQKLRTGVVNGSDHVIDAYTTAINGALTKIDAVEQEANGADAPDPALLAEAAADDLTALTPVGTDLPDLVHTNPTLRAAYQQAKDCKDAQPLTTPSQQSKPTTSQ